MSTYLPSVIYAALLYSAGASSLAGASVTHDDAFRHLKGRFLHAKSHPRSSDFFLGSTWQCKGFHKSGQVGTFDLKFKEVTPTHLRNTKVDPSNKTWVRELELDSDWGWQAGDHGGEDRHFLQVRFDSGESQLVYRVSVYDPNALTNADIWLGEEYGFCQLKPLPKWRRWLLRGL